MIATKGTCLTTEEMSRLIRGDMEPADFDSAAAHVDGCDRCQSLAHQIEGPRPVELGHAEDSVQAESACHFAIGRLLESSRRSAQTTPPVERLGPYQILGDLGQGGMGTVCLAEHDRLKRRCAIKLLPPTRVNQPGWLDRFEREMAAVASLEHPGIVRASDAGTESGWHYLVMEYLDGLDVGRVANRVGKLSIANACEIVRQASLALAHVHRSGLVHRDVKPSNLMLTRSGVVKLLDLGLVLPGDDPLATDDRLTTVGHLMGTLPAMSPEQLMDSRRVDASADVYSLGSTLYRLISGRWPFASDGGIAARVLAITSDSPKPLSTVQPEVDDDLNALVMRMLAHDPRMRPSADATADEIKRWASNSDLKTVIRRAEQLSEPENGSRPSISMPGKASRQRPPTSGSGKRFIGVFWPMAWLATGAILATVVIQIRTDRGTVVVKTDGNDTQVEVVPHDPIAPTTKDASSPERLYLGKNFDHWNDVFQREQQIEAIGQAMRAVELLSRDTPERAEAAKQTMQLANEYGTYQFDETPDDANAQFGSPSSSPERFMGYLTESFPNYFPQPALNAIDETLAAGNYKAKIAATLVLNHYTTGVYQSTVYPERKASAKEFFTAFVKTDDGKSTIESLLMHLGEASAAFKPNSRDALSSDDSQQSLVVSEATWGRKTAWATAIEIVSAAGNTVEPPSWIANYVTDNVHRAVGQFRDRSVDPATGETIVEKSSFFGGYPMAKHPNWVIDGDVLLAALEMRREQRLEVPTDFAVEVLMHPAQSWYGWEAGGYKKAFELLTQLDSETSIMVAKRFDQLVKAALSEYDETNRPEVFQSFWRSDFFETVGPIFAKNVTPIDDAFARIQKMENMYREQGNRVGEKTFQEMNNIFAHRLASKSTEGP